MKTLAMTEARKNLFALGDEVARGETVILQRRRREDPALVTARELTELRKERNQRRIRYPAGPHSSVNGGAG